MRKLVCIVLLVLSCAGKKELFKPTAQELYLRAEKAYKQGEYSDAIEILDRLILEYATSDYRPKATLLAGKCLLAQGDYPPALSKFQMLSQEGEGAIQEEAMYLVGKTLLKASPKVERDQEKTHKAIRAFEEFLSLYPSSEFAPLAKRGLSEAKNKLAEKDYLTALLYYKLEKFESSLLYLNQIIDNYPESNVIPKTLLLKGRANLKLGRSDKARRVLSLLVNEYPTSQAADEALKKLEDLN